jgi:hypothetical protein
MTFPLPTGRGSFPPCDGPRMTRLQTPSSDTIVGFVASMFG